MSKFIDLFADKNRRNNGKHEVHLVWSSSVAMFAIDGLIHLYRAPKCFGVFWGFLFLGFDLEILLMIRQLNTNLIVCSLTIGLNNQSLHAGSVFHLRNISGIQQRLNRPGHELESFQCNMIHGRIYIDGAGIPHRRSVDGTGIGVGSEEEGAKCGIHFGRDGDLLILGDGHF